MTEFWMGIGMIAGAPVFGIVSAILAVCTYLLGFGPCFEKDARGR